MKKCLLLALTLSCALHAQVPTPVYSTLPAVYVPDWFFTRSVIPVPPPPPTEQDIALMAMGNYTTPSLGEFSNVTVIRQSNRTSAGGSVGYELWRRGNGFVTDYSFTPTDSKLFGLAPGFKFSKEGQWNLQRHKVDLMYEHRFRAKCKFQPYLGVGGFVIVLWGGYAPHGWPVPASGWDGWGGEVTTAGITTHLSPRLALKTGLLVDIGKASTYGDTTYQASQNLMFEPQIGLVWKLTK